MNKDKDKKIDQTSPEFYLKLDYGEGCEHLGKIIPKLTDAQKKEANSLTLMTRSVPGFLHCEDEFRRGFAFSIIFGDDAFTEAYLASIKSKE